MLVIALFSRVTGLKNPTVLKLLFFYDTILNILTKMLSQIIKP